MCELNKEINEHYTEFYLKRRHLRVYPTEFVVRTFLSEYPGLHMDKLKRGDIIIDIGCGDGRNTLFLMEQGYEVYGTEISQKIVDVTQKRLDVLTEKVKNMGGGISVGRNSNLPYVDAFADAILACHVCYYCDKGEGIEDNLREYSRVLKRGGILVASVLHSESYLLSGGDKMEDGTTIVRNDPYNNRNGYRLKGFSSKEEIENLFSKWFYDFSFGQAHNDWYGIDEKVWWVVCKKK